MKDYLDVSENIKMHKFSLQFKNKKIENFYIREYKNRFYKTSRMGVLFGTIILLIFIILEFTVFGTTDKMLFTVKFKFILPGGLIGIFLSLAKPIKRFSFWLNGGIIFCTTIGLSFMILLNPNNIHSPSLLGLMMFYIFSFSIIRITFIRTFIILYFLYTAFSIYILATSGVSNLSSFSSWYFLGACLIFSAFAGYFFEYIDRINFITNRDLKRKNKAFESLKNELEKKVVTRTKKLNIANQRLKLAISKAEESDKLKSKFLSTISHEIRTPLTGILGYSQLIAKTNSNPEKQNKHIESLEESTDKLLSIISNILELSEIQSDRLETSHSLIDYKSISKNIEEQAQTILKKHNKDLDFHIQYEDHIPFKINIGGKEFNNILMHLLDNAVKYTNVGNFGFSCKINKKNMFEFCIYDSGIGIAKDKLNTIFDFFRQIDQSDDRKYSGIGVGLSICKGYVSNSNGKIWVKSTEGKGTKVYVAIPIVEN